MVSKANTVNEYFQDLSEDRKGIMNELRMCIKEHLPEGFQECMGYGMPAYVVPHSLYPAGYHCDPKPPLPFISLASQKNHISFYHMGLYEGSLLPWFQEEWKKHASKKLDMGRCCVRFKKPEDVPLKLIGALCTRITPAEWIKTYENTIKR